MFLQIPDSNSADLGHHGMWDNYTDLEPFLVDICSHDLDRRRISTVLCGETVAIDRFMGPLFDNDPTIAIEGDGSIAGKQASNR
jgi:hypothetical protein